MGRAATNGGGAASAVTSGEHKHEHKHEVSLVFGELAGHRVLKIIGPSEAVFRKTAGVVMMLASAGLYFANVAPLQLFGAGFTGGMIFFNSGAKFQCGMAFRGLWDLHGQGYAAIPDEYLEFAVAKRREIAHDFGLLGLSGLLFSLSSLWLRGQLSHARALYTLEAFALLFAIIVTLVLVPASRRSSCQ
jgi:hypothetical protein